MSPKKLTVIRSNPTSMRLTIITLIHMCARARTRARCLQSSRLVENTKIAARHCHTNTTHNLCTPRRDATIMKESRCELINLAKPEKGTPESIRVGYTLSAYLSARFFPSPCLRRRCVETFWFISYSVYSYFLKSFSFIMQKIHRCLSAVSNSCVNVTRSLRNGFFFPRFLLNFKLHFSSDGEICFFSPSSPKRGS